MTLDYVKSKIRAIPDFPKKGIMFRDITTLLKDSKGFNFVIDEFVLRYEKMDVDFVVGIESRGFILGAALAHRLDVGFIPIRKKGKLPAEVIREEYSLEYGTDVVEMHKDALKKGNKVLLVDDLLATGGTACAACKLIEKMGAIIVECAFVIDLPDLGGKTKLAPHKVYAMVEFEGE
ncbi:MAG: adenine phosphoribosyltransferase [archaeon]